MRYPAPKTLFHRLTNCTTTHWLLYIYSKFIRRGTAIQSQNSFKHWTSCSRSNTNANMYHYSHQASWLLQRCNRLGASVLHTSFNLFILKYLHLQAKHCVGYWNLFCINKCIVKTNSKDNTERLHVFTLIPCRLQWWCQWRPVTDVLQMRLHTVLIISVYLTFNHSL